MTLKQLKTISDEKLATFWTVLQTKQDAYFARHGKYFQLLISPETSVVDGVDSKFTVRHPSDEKYVIDVNFSFTSKIPFQIVVNEWVGKKSIGYWIRATIKLSDTGYYQRIIVSTGRDSNWFKFIPKEQ